MEELYEFKRNIQFVPTIKTVNVDRKRHYVTPTNNTYPSITTVLSTRHKEGLFEWRKRVGEDVANYIARTSANRGSVVHKICEDYLCNKHIYSPEEFRMHEVKTFLPYCLFNQLRKKALHNIDNIYAQETALWSDELMVAGRVDCIADYEGTPSVIDFKTARSERNDDWNLNYYTQATAYCQMFEERTGIEINQVVILVVTEDGSVQEFIKDKKDYQKELEEALNEFHHNRLAS